MLHQGDEQIEGLTQDISMSGLKVKCLEPICDKTALEVRIQLYIPNGSYEGQEDTLVVRGKIMHADQKADGTYYGIKFAYMGDGEKAVLKRIFDHFMKSYKFA